MKFLFFFLITLILSFWHALPLHTWGWAHAIITSKVKAKGLKKNPFDHMDLESLFSLTRFVKYNFFFKLEPQHPLINSNFLFREYTFIFNDRCWPLMRSLREYSCINSLHNFFAVLLHMSLSFWSITHVTFPLTKHRKKIWNLLAPLYMIC